ncbi:retrovirus-related pol polyprotein from transposon TNT 1-94 [Tanacetum coccineum]
MLAKQNDPNSKEKKINTTPINYVELNQLSEDFGKRFVPQQELSIEQAFWLQTSNPIIEQFDISPVRIEAPSEPPKVSLVNTSLKKLKIHLSKFDTVVKKHITPDAITEGEWGFEHTKAAFLNEIIPFLKTLKDICNVFDKDLLNELKEHIKSMRENDKEEQVKPEIDETETINIELKHSVAKLLFENELLHKEIKHFKKIYKDSFDSIIKTRACSKEHSDSLISQLNSKSIENDNLKSQIQEKVFVTTTLQYVLRILKGKNVLDNATTITNATTIAPRMFKLDIDPISQRLKNNRDAHEDYLKKTIENTDTIRGLGSNATDVPSSSFLINDKLSRLFSGTVRFGNDQIAKIMGYGDYQLGNVTISRFLIWDLDGVDLLSGSRDTKLYTNSLDDMLKTSPICLLSKSSKTKSCLWHRWLSHLNFGTLNQLAKDGLARGIPKLKFKKDHLCSACALDKSKKSSHQPKAEDTNQEKLYLLHMDLCDSMRVESINGKKYILVIVDDYS